MSRLQQSSSGSQLLNLLKHFNVSKDRYSIDEFMTFLRFIPFLPIQQQKLMKSDKLRDIETSHKIFLKYLQKRLSLQKDSNGKYLKQKKDYFTYKQFEGILNQTPDMRLLGELCEGSMNKQEMIDTVCMIIRSNVSKNNNENEMTEYIRNSIEKSGRFEDLYRMQQQKKKQQNKW